MYKCFFKRFFDIVLSGLGIVFLLPFFIIFTPIVAIAMKGNPFFVQERPGKDGKVFNMIKYRTMTNAKNKEGQLLSDEERLTKFGNLLRKLSIDELPELFNILKGDMSIVGPRPQLIRDMLFFDEHIMERQTVRPGLTGLAQVNGRNNISWEEKFEYDLQYIKNTTLFEDIKILLKTVITVLKRSNVSTDGMATAEDYGEYLLRIGKITTEEWEIVINQKGIMAE